MWENFKATVIQNFYRRFIKCSRDNTTTCKIKIENSNKRKYIEIPCPIDPLYRIPYDEKYHIRLVEWHQKMKKPCVWHFNIQTLIDWLNINKEWINPMTNCLFLNRTIDKIIGFINERNIKKKLKIKTIYNYKEQKKLKTINNYDGKIYVDLLIKSIEENSEKDCFNLLNNNYDKIETDYFKIDSDIEKTIEIINEKITPISALHYAIFKKNRDIAHHLMYFGSNLEKKCGQSGYTALHLAAILNLPEIGILIKMYGGNINEECIFEGKASTIFDICDKLGHNDFIMKLLI